MKSLLIGLMLVAVACAAGKQGRKRDVNEILDSGAGWTKGEDGYKYDIPATQLEVKSDPIPEVQVVEEPVEEVVPEVTIVEEQAPIVNEPVVVEEIVPYDTPAVENEYLPPTNEYLPPQARKRLRFRRRYRLVRRQ